MKTAGISIAILGAVLVLLGAACAGADTRYTTWREVVWNVGGHREWHLKWSVGLLWFTRDDTARGTWSTGLFPFGRYWIVVQYVDDECSRLRRDDRVWYGDKSFDQAVRNELDLMSEKRERPREWYWPK